MVRFTKLLPKGLRRLGVAAALGSLMGGACGGACQAESPAGRPEAAARESRLAMRAPLAKETAARPPALSAEAAGLEAARAQQAEAARKGVLALLAVLAQGGPESALWADSGRGLRPRRTSRAADGRDPSAQAPCGRRLRPRRGKA